MVGYAIGWVKYETTSSFEKQKGSGEYWTTREVYERSGKDVPDYEPSIENQYLTSEFWQLKSYAGSIEDPLRREYFSGTLLDRNERAIILAMDAAFRSELTKVRHKNDKILASRNK